MIPYGRQSISDEDIQSVVDVLKSDWLTQGPKVPEFEQAVARYVGAQFAVAVNSATSALHIACLALGVGPKSRVWTSPNSFVASANCALYCGADIDFVDISPDTGNMCVVTLESQLNAASAKNELPDVVIPVHFAGQPCDMAKIYALSKQFGFRIIEDASHAIGAEYENKKVGSNCFADVTVFSFHPVKIMTSAEGGIATTSCPTLNRKMQRLRSHGVTNLTDEMTEPSHGPWYYQQIELGFNYRMTELQAALGLSQLKRVDEFVSRRNILALRYDELFKSVPAAQPLAVKRNCTSAYHLYVIRVEDLTNTNHQLLVSLLREQGIFAHVHYIPIHLQPYYKKLGFKPGDFPHCEHYYQQAITLPLYPELTVEEQSYIAKTLIDAIKEFR